MREKKRKNRKTERYRDLPDTTQKSSKSSKKIWDYLFWGTLIGVVIFQIGSNMIDRRSLLKHPKLAQAIITGTHVEKVGKFSHTLYIDYIFYIGKNTYKGKGEFCDTDSINDMIWVVYDTLNPSNNMLHRNYPTTAPVLDIPDSLKR